MAVTFNTLLPKLISIAFIDARSGCIMNTLVLSLLQVGLTIVAAEGSGLKATSFTGSLIFPKRDPGLGWSRVFQILADSTDVLEGSGWKVKVCLALSLATEPGRE